MFEGLLPEPHNTIVLTLLFTFATWHAYAKLRLHSSSTIRSFRIVTTDLGSKARKFIRTTCAIYVTYELPQEESRRARRKAQKQAKSPGNNPNPAAAKSSKTRKEWNITTYKWHSLGDYADTIVDFGTTDSYSTQIVGHITVFNSGAHTFLRANLRIVSPKSSMLKQISAILSGR